VKIVHLTTLYSSYFSDFERRYPQIAVASFEEHRRVLYADGFGWSDYFARHLAARGHEAHHIISNYGLLQAKWARENAVVPDPAQTAFSIVRAQVAALQPEVLFVEDCYRFPASAVKALMKAAPSIRAVACYHGIEGDIIPLVPPEALLLVPAAHLAADWAKLGYKTALVRHAFEPAVLESLGPQGVKSPLTFIGNCSPFLHPERHAWLKEMARSIPELELWTDSFAASPWALAKMTVASLVHRQFGRVYQHFVSPLRRRARPAVYGLPMFRALRDSRITLNCHITLSRPSAANMRLFEATGVGTCLVTDAREDMEDVFAPDKEVVTYTNTDECIEKVRWLSDHPAEADAIGQRGQQRTLRQHTFAHRASQLEALLEDQLNCKPLKL
jgi:spore maturation protein CgeB